MANTQFTVRRQIQPAPIADDIKKIKRRQGLPSGDNHTSPHQLHIRNIGIGSLRCRMKNATSQAHDQRDDNGLHDIRAIYVASAIGGLELHSSSPRNNIGSLGRIPAGEANIS